jgi:hypothetical protein
MTSPTQRTLKLLRDMGANAIVLERWNQWARRRMDVWGADILALHGRLLMAIQATSDANHSHRVTKAIADPNVRNWLDGGVAFYIYSWGKKGPRGKRKVWKVKITQLITNADNSITTLTHGSEILSTGYRPQTKAA